jgi:hypothetical protein
MIQGESKANSTKVVVGEAVAGPVKPPRLLRVALWQAIAGMAVALAIASGLVALGLARSLANRTNYMNRRVAALNATLRDVRKQTSAVQRKLGTVRERATIGEVFEKILFAPDLRTIKLTVPTEKSGPAAIDAHAAVGMLAMSESAGVAMLEANGLKPSGDRQVYRIWWMPKRGIPVWVADFLVGEDGHATVPVDLPSSRQLAPTITVTLENEAYAEAPSGPVALKAVKTPR